MAATLQQIRQPVAEELEQFERYFKQALKSRVMLLDRVMQYIVKRKGKQMRPLFVLLSAELCGGVTPATYRGAALVELLHTATLVHDDVVDDSDKRRGFFSINALWKNKLAVLVGDYLLSRGLLMSLEYDDFQLLKIVSNAVKLMSEGELLQMEKARALNVDEPVYYDIIRQKTASLIASCTEVGASSAGADADTQERMRQFGEAVGMAFQIKDDLLDYGGAQSGKPTGIDLKERKMTLPLIYTLNRCSWAERRRLIYVVRNQSERPEKAAWVMHVVRERGGLSYSQQKMAEYVAQARTLLHQFPETPARQALDDLVTFTIEREV